MIVQEDYYSNTSIKYLYNIDKVVTYVEHTPMLFIDIKNNNLNKYTKSNIVLIKHMVKVKNTY